MKVTRADFIIIAAFVLLVPLIMIGLGISSLNRDQDLRNDLARSGQRVPGVITSLRGAKGSTNTSHIKFQTRDGQDVETTYGDVMDFPERSRLSVGKTVDIVYDPDDPLRAIPAPYPAVLKRDKVLDLGAFLKKMGLGVFVSGLPILILALLFGKIFAARTKRKRSG